MFRETFEKFDGVSDEIRKAGPRQASEAHATENAGPPEG